MSVDPSGRRVTCRMTLAKTLARRVEFDDGPGLFVFRQRWQSFRVAVAVALEKIDVGITQAAEAHEPGGAAIPELLSYLRLSIIFKDDDGGLTPGQRRGRGQYAAVVFGGSGLGLHDLALVSVNRVYDQRGAVGVVKCLGRFRRGAGGDKKRQAGDGGNGECAFYAFDGICHVSFSCLFRFLRKFCFRLGSEIATPVPN